MSMPSKSFLTNSEANTGLRGSSSARSALPTRVIGLSLALIAGLTSCGQTGELTRPDTEIARTLISHPR